MMNIKSLSCLLIVLIHSISSAQWISIDKYSIPDSPPNVQLISDDATSTIIKVDLSGFQINEFTANGKTYQSISFDSEGITSEVGYPEIPHIAKVLAIPNHGSVSVEVVEVGNIQTIKGINIPPARESWEEGKPETPYLENMLAYNSEDVYPNNLQELKSLLCSEIFVLQEFQFFPSGIHRLNRRFKQYHQLL